MWPAAKIIGTTGRKNLQVSMLAGDVFGISSRVIELAVQSRIHVITVDSAHRNYLNYLHVTQLVHIVLHLKCE